MTSGRKPTPTALKIVKGNPGKRALPKKEPKAAPSRPIPPDFLTLEALEEWFRVIDELYQLGIVTEFDRGALAAYCQAYGQWAHAERLLLTLAQKDKATGGLLIKTTNGNYIQNPIVGIANKARADMVKFAAEFGMTPAARSKVEANPLEEKDNTESFFS